MSEAERAIREALPFATPGRWEHVFSNGGREHYVYAPDAHYRRDLPGPVKVAWLPPSPGSNRDANDAVYIAACNPENIAAVLAEIDRLTRERDEARAERDDLRGVLMRHGFVPCDIPACNCGSWHARFGYPERMREIKDTLDEAGHPLSNENGNMPLNALRELIAERDALAKERLAKAVEAR